MRHRLVTLLSACALYGCGAEASHSASKTESVDSMSSGATSTAGKEVDTETERRQTGAPLAASFDSRGQKVIDDFHRLYFDAYAATFGATRYMGVPVLKVPADLWAYQEILFEVRPDVVIETGTFAGGSALFIAHVLEQIGHGRIITVDYWNHEQAAAKIDRGFPFLADRKDFRPQHHRLTYLHGPSTQEATKSALLAMVGDGERGLVILDSDHSKSHVLEELAFYQRFVAEGSYLVVEDTNTDNNPLPWCGDGPLPAVRDFLQRTPDFVADRSREKFLMTLNPMGFLRRTGGR